MRSLDPTSGLQPTPARLWDVRDTISHLADVDEMAIDTIADGPHALNAIAARAASDDDVTYQGVMRGRRLAGADVLAWWERTSAARAGRARRSWIRTRGSAGASGCAPATLVTARMMETWAHGLDVYAARHTEPVDTDRLAHVAWLSTRALPYAYTVARREPPPEPLRVELTLPSGAPWTFGPEDAPARITGPASRVLPGVRAAADRRRCHRPARDSVPRPWPRSKSRGRISDLASESSL